VQGRNVVLSERRVGPPVTAPRAWVCNLTEIRREKYSPTGLKKGMALTRGAMLRRVVIDARAGCDDEASVAGLHFRVAQPLGASVDVPYSIRKWSGPTTRHTQPSEIRSGFATQHAEAPIMISSECVCMGGRLKI
jgi:hypothetical protein